MDYLTRAKDVINIEIEGLQQLSKRLSTPFSDAVETILKSLKDHGKIVLTGVGKNLPIAEKISATFSSTGATSVVLNPAQAAHGDLGIIHPGDTLLVLLYSGASDELFTFLPSVRRGDTHVIGLTGSTTNPLSEFCDVILYFCG